MGKEVLIEMSKDEENNLKHRFKFINTRNGFNLINFIKDDFNFVQLYENDKGIQNPDKMTFTLEMVRKENKTNIIGMPLGELVFDKYMPIKEFVFDGLYTEEVFNSTKVVDIETPISNIVMVGDTIEITDYARENDPENNNYHIFTGYCTNITYRYTNMRLYFDIELEDLTYKGFDTYFEETIFLKDKFIYNSNDLENSLLYILCKFILRDTTQAGILSNINIPDIKYPNGIYRKILFTQLTKDEMVYKHFAQIVDSFGGKCYMEDNKLTVKSPLGALYADSYTDWTIPSINYEYTEDNILNSITEKNILEFNKVVVNYDQFEVASEQKIYQLMGVNGSEKEGDAKVSVDANVDLLTNKNYFEVNFISDFVMDINPVFKTAAHYYTIESDENSRVNITLTENVHYQIDYDETGGKIKFGNSLSYKLFIDTFIIYGTPVMKTSDNSYEYTRTEVVERDIKPKTIEGNPYIQNMVDAEMLAKYMYFKHCMMSKTLEFDSNICTPMNPNTLVTMNHIDAKYKVIIDECSHSCSMTKIKATKYEEFDLNTFQGGINSNKNSTDYNIMKGLDYIQDDIITIDPESPVAVQNLLLVTNFEGFYAKWDEILGREDIRGYYINIKYTLDEVVSQSESFSSTTSKYIPAQYMVNNNGSVVQYEVKVKAVTLKGLVGAYSTIEYVIPLKTISGEKQIAAHSIIGDNIAANTITSNNINVENLVVENISVLNSNNYVYMKDNDINSKLILGAKDVVENNILNAKYNDIQFQIGDDSGLVTDSYLRYNKTSKKFETKFEEMDLRYTLSNASLSDPVTELTVGEYYQIFIDNMNTTHDGKLVISIGGNSTEIALTMSNDITSYTFVILANNTDLINIVPQDGWTGAYSSPVVRKVSKSQSVLKMRDIDGNISNEIRIFNVSSKNTAIGFDALKLNTVGYNNTTIGYNASTSNTTGCDNTVIGSEALSLNTTGDDNTAIGSNTLSLNTIGYSNTAVGSDSLKKNTTGRSNTAIGYSSLVDNTIGNDNTAIGSDTLSLNTIGYSNTAVGRNVLSRNTTGRSNTAIGYSALYLNNIGRDNVAVGDSALINNNIGIRNTGIGYFALSTSGSKNNCSGIGANSQITDSNQVQLGDSLTTTYVYGTVQNRSDRRDKSDITETNIGLDFILNLKPVVYKWDMREDYTDKHDLEEGLVNKNGSKKRNRNHSGFIAQEVKETMDKLGVDFGGYQDHSINGGMDVLSLGYDEFIAPIVKAIQELNEKIRILESK